MNPLKRKASTLERQGLKSKYFKTDSNTRLSKNSDFWIRQARNESHRVNITHSTGDKTRAQIQLIISFLDSALNAKEPLGGCCDSKSH